ncbi:MAG: hypothetical protein CM15mV60_190 [uncultured marine virus]|nr:MAG: hypothetical protein CM15mV60_190 [uncultured marine virus]
MIARDTNRAKEIVDNLTREIDAIYPEAERLFGRANVAERDKFLSLLNKSLFEGDLNKPLNKDALDETLKLMNKTNLPAERRQAIIGGLIMQEKNL